MEKKRGGGYGGRGGHHKGGETHDVKFSKTLSMLLRHKAKEFGLKITSDGFVNIEELFGLEIMQKYKPDMEKLKAVVNDNDKKRFEISSDEKMIRAVQGHSMEVSFSSKKSSRK